MNIATEFFQKVLADNYGQDVEEILVQFSDEKELAAYKLGEPKNDQELVKLKDLAKIHPLGALLAAWSYFEKTLDKFIADLDLEKSSRRPFAMDLVMGNVNLYGLDVPRELRSKIDSVRRTRNMVAHGKSDPSKSQVNEAIKIIDEVDQYFASLDLSEVRAKALINRKEHEMLEKERAIKRSEQDDLAERMYNEALARAGEEDEKAD